MTYLTGLEHRIVFWCLSIFLLLPACPAPSQEPNEAEKLFRDTKKFELNEGIAVSDKGNYIGNLISPSFTLNISGDAEKTWKYTFVDNKSGFVKNPPMAVSEGSYQLDGDLAIFTGKSLLDGKPKAEEFRFGINFGHVGKEVRFNRLLPTADGKQLRYHRKWFKKADKGWQPALELVLTMPAEPPGKDAKTWEVKFKGERTIWTEGGKKVEPVEVAFVYKRDAYVKAYYYMDKRPSPAWLPQEIYPEVLNGRLVSVMTAAPIIGALRGFHPGLAALP
jgi:hypothetical protein